MIIICLSGGLGNQLQQYALYRRFISLGIDAKMDVSWFDEDVQVTVAARRSIELDRLSGVEYDICTQAEKERFTGRGFLGKKLRQIGVYKGGYYTECSVYDPKVLDITDGYLDGSFTCDAYYEEILPELRQNVAFPLDECHNPGVLNRIVSDIGRQYSIGIHIRRQDYLDDINASIYGNICTNAYYSAALDIALENIDRAGLYVFSDDPEYAAEYTPKLAAGRDGIISYEVVDVNRGDDSLFDMYLMSLCDCVITANSTFSYWGARLNAREKVIRIRPAIHKNSQQLSSEDVLKLWRGWISISSEGIVYR